MLKKFTRLVVMALPIAVVVMLVGTIGVAYGATQEVAGSTPNTTLPFSTDFVWSLVAGALAPLVGYVINYAGPQVKESVKLVVQTVVAAVAGGIAQAVAVGGVGFNDVTLQYVVAAVFAAGLGHGWWKAGGINTILGGGRNR